MKRDLFSNDTEQGTYTKIIELIDLRVYLPVSYDNYLNTVKRIKKKNVNSLFARVKSPCLTPTGDNRTTEMALQCPDFSIDVRIECKHLDKCNGIVAASSLDLMEVRHHPEKEFWLVLAGEGYNNPYAMSKIDETIGYFKVKHKVVVINYDNFTEYLKKRIGL